MSMSPLGSIRNSNFNFLYENHIDTLKNSLFKSKTTSVWWKSADFIKVWWSAKAYLEHGFVYL